MLQQLRQTAAGAGRAAAGRPRTSMLRKKAVVVCGFSPNLGDDFLSSSGSSSGRDSLAAGNKSPPKLILPGQQDVGSSVHKGGSKGGSLILPTTGNGGAKEETAAGKPVPQQFRPPPGFMNEYAASSNAAGGGGVKQEELSADEMIRRLQANQGHWHEIATYLPKLQREGYDSAIIEEMTGIDRKVQNLMSISSLVYDSLRQSGKVEKLSYFDRSGAENLLYEIRMLSIEQRIAAAIYIEQHKLETPECLTLARAIKEHERRSGEKRGILKLAGRLPCFQVFQGCY